MESSDNSEKKKRDLTKKLFSLLKIEPSSRRMAVTLLGFPDQTYLITNQIFEWLINGKAQIVGKFKCKRSGRLVQFITTDENLFSEDTQFKIEFLK